MVNIEDVSINDDFTQIKGVGTSIQEKLKNAGYRSFEQLANAKLQDLSQLNKINSNLAAKIIEHAKIKITKSSDINIPDSKNSNDVNKNHLIKPHGNLMSFIGKDSNNSIQSINVSEFSSVPEDSENSEKYMIDIEDNIEKFTQDKNNFCEKIDDDPEIISEDFADPDQNKVKFKAVKSPPTSKSEILENVKGISEPLQISEAEDFNQYASIDVANEETFDGDMRKLPDVNKLINIVEKKNLDITENKLNKNYVESVINKFIDDNHENIYKINSSQDFIESTENNSISDEILTSEKIIETKDHILNSIHSKEYSILKKDSKNFDFIAIKSIHIKDFLDHIIIIPVKICPLKGKIVVSNDKISYFPSNLEKKYSNFINEQYLNPIIETILSIQEKIYQDIRDQGQYFNYIKRYLKTNITLERSISGKPLFLKNGVIQYRVLIEPIILCNEDTESSESLISYPYQKRLNLHIVNYKDLLSLIEYLEKKYSIIEKLSKKEGNSIKRFDSQREIFSNNLQKYSLPFVIYGFIFMLIIIFQQFLLLNFFIGLGYAALGIYSVIIVYFLYKFYTAKKEIIKDSSRPLYQKQVNLDELQLKMLEDELGSENINQFIFESVNKDLGIYLESRPLNRELDSINPRVKLNPQNKNLAFDENEQIFREKDSTVIFQKKPIEKKKLSTKYISFLED